LVYKVRKVRKGLVEAEKELVFITLHFALSLEPDLGGQLHESVGK